MMIKDGKNHRLNRTSLEVIEDYDGSTIYISPNHPKYKELKQLENARKWRNESE